VATVAKVLLTEKSVAAATAEGGERLELWDTKTAGLCLRVSGNGAKSWVFRYRTLDGRQPRLKLGDHSLAFGLADARDRAERIRVAVRDGSDPAADKRRAGRTAKAEPIKTFDQLADAYLQACESGEWKPKNKKKRARTISDERGILRRHVRPRIGKERLADIDRKGIKALLRDMVAAGINAQTNRTQAVIRQVFAYAIAEERVSINPATGFAPFATEQPRSRVLSDTELKEFWAGLVDPSGMKQPPGEDGEAGAAVQVGRPVRIALQLCTLLLQRRGEVAGMAMSELDLPKGLWLIPAERMKGGVAHLVPLPTMAVALIKEAIELASGKGNTPPKVFPSPRDLEKSIKADSLTHAMHELTSALGIVGATPHDLRRTGATELTGERLGQSPFIRSKVLAHRADAGGGAAVSSIHYDANSYIAEKRKALEAWGALVLTVTSEPSRGRIQHPSLDG
jgi:integrase